MQVTLITSVLVTATQEHFAAYFSQLLQLKLRSATLPQAIEDVRQETFARVFSVLRKDGLRQPERLGAFVNMVCNHVLFEHYRSTTGSESLDVEAGRVSGQGRQCSGARCLPADQRQSPRDSARPGPRDRSLLQAFFSTSATETKSAANLSGPRLSASAAPSRQTGVQIEYVKRVGGQMALGANT